MRHRTLTGPEGGVHYWTNAVNDTDTALVFLHGATMDHCLFEPQAEHFKRHWKVINWDAPAHGLSRPWAVFTLDEAAERLAAMLDQEGMARAHLVGQSMGGYQAQVFAKQYPERVASIVSVGSSPLARRYFSGFDRFMLRIAPALLALWPKTHLDRLIANQVALTELGRRYAFDTVSRMTTAEVRDVMAAVYGAVRDFGDDPVSPPALLITLGDHERTGKVRSYCARWHAEEGWPLKWIPQAAHNANLDNPAAFNHLLECWLGQANLPQPGNESSDL